MFGKISLRYKIPINLSVAILLTAVVIGSVLIWRSYEEVRNDLFRSSVELGTVLSRTLTAPLKHDDVWQAYQILRSAGSRIYIVVDEQQRGDGPGQADQQANNKQRADQRLAEFTGTTIGLKLAYHWQRNNAVYLRVSRLQQKGDSHPDDAIGSQRNQDLFADLNANMVQLGLQYFIE